MIKEGSIRKFWRRKHKFNGREVAVVKVDVADTFMVALVDDVVRGLLAGDKRTLSTWRCRVWELRELQ